MIDERTTSVRLGIIGIVCISLFASLFARLWYLQVVDPQEFQAAASAVRFRTIHEEGPRGRILDRNGNVLVDNRTSIVVGLFRPDLPSFEGTEEERRTQRLELFGRLAVVLSEFGFPTKVTTIDLLYQDPRYSQQDLVPLVEDNTEEDKFVPEELELYLAEHKAEFPGVEVRRRSIRIYPYGTAAAHILGYVGSINEDELKAREEEFGKPGEEGSLPKAYGPGDEIGKAGIERYFERDLRATPGDTVIQVDARGDYLRTVSESELSRGDDVWLAIDINVQIMAEQMLAQKIAERRLADSNDDPPFKAPQGSAVIIDPRNGQVIAMASYPSYDPSQLVNGISTEVWERLNSEANGQPLFNWASLGAYAPGSTFKPFTAHAALESGFLGINDTIEDRGAYRLEDCNAGKCEFQNADRVPYGSVNLQKSLTVSSDVFYYRLGDELWRGRGIWGDSVIQDSARKFGFGETTGIELPGESAGLIGDPEWLLKVATAAPEAFDHKNWTVGDNLNTSIGQGTVNVTPLQLASAYATLSNEGKRYRPALALAVTRPKDISQPVVDWNNIETVREIEPELVEQVEFTVPESYPTIYRGLQGVTTSSAGTANDAFNQFPTAWPAAGKTGTAQVNRKADTSVFAGWGPADGITEPQYAIAVIIPEAGFGGEAAAPLAFQILQPISYGAIPIASPNSGIAQAPPVVAAPPITVPSKAERSEGDE